MRLEEIKVGSTYLLADPVRIAKVTGKTTVDVMVDPQTRTFATKPAMEVIVTIPASPIAGFVEASQAKRGAKVRASLQGNDLEGSFRDESLWTEVWSEQAVPKLVNPEGSPAKLDEQNLEIKLFCVSEAGRNSERARTSPVVGKTIEGKLIPPALVPKDAFEKATAEVA